MSHTHPTDEYEYDDEYNNEHAPGHSEQPGIWISYDHGPAEDNATFSYQGQYVPEDVLPFAIADCAGTYFTMDGIVCELLGDMGGHAVYRRRRSESVIYTMDWETFAQEQYAGVIEIMG